MTKHDGVTMAYNANYSHLQALQADLEYINQIFEKTDSAQSYAISFFSNDAKRYSFYSTVLKHINFKRNIQDVLKQHKVWLENEITSTQAEVNRLQILING